jgi:hypothetical protein
MLELSSQFDFAPSEIARVLEVLEKRGLVARSGDPALVYTGGVRWWATARAGEPDVERLGALLNELRGGQPGLEGWIAPERRAVVIYLPLRTIEAALQGAGAHLEALGRHIRDLLAAGRVGEVQVAATITMQRGEPALEVVLTPDLGAGP